jgi:hypothetical protein
MATTISLENAVSKLLPHDQKHCGQLFKCYQDLANIIFNQRMYGFLQLDDVRSVHPDIFPEGIELMERLSQLANLTMKDLAKVVIIKIETYFQQRYQLPFTSLLESPSFQEELKDLSRLPCMDIVIYNILHQAGPQYFGPVFN